MINIKHSVNTDFFSSDISIRKKSNTISRKLMAYKLILIYVFTLTFDINLILLQRLEQTVN